MKGGRQTRGVEEPLNFEQEPSDWISLAKWPTACWVLVGAGYMLGHAGVERMVAYLRCSGHKSGNREIHGNGEAEGRVSQGGQVNRGAGSHPVPPGARSLETRTHMRRTWRPAALRA